MFIKLKLFDNNHRVTNSSFITNIYTEFETFWFLNDRHVVNSFGTIQRWILFSKNVQLWTQIGNELKFKSYSFLRFVMTNIKNYSCNNLGEEITPKLSNLVAMESKHARSHIFDKNFATSFQVEVKLA